MTTLIVPDIHERLHSLLKIEEVCFPRADRIVMLGDFFDSFLPFNERRLRDICSWITEHITDDKITFIIANHDCHYLFTHPGFLCSGYDPRKAEIIRELVKPDVISRFKLFTHVGPYLVSHAGFCEATLQCAKPEVAEAAIRVAMEGGWDPIFGAGRARGGRQMWGGPTWLDWNSEFAHIDNIPQIVGHTNGKNIRTKGATQADSKVDEDGNIIVDVGLMSYCIDTASKWVVWVDEETGEVTPEEIGSYGS